MTNQGYYKKQKNYKEVIPQMDVINDFDSWECERKMIGVGYMQYQKDENDEKEYQVIYKGEKDLQRCHFEKRINHQRSNDTMG